MTDNKEKFSLRSWDWEQSVIDYRHPDKLYKYLKGKANIMPYARAHLFADIHRKHVNMKASGDYTIPEINRITCNSLVSHYEDEDGLLIDMARYMGLVDGLTVDETYTYPLFIAVLFYVSMAVTVGLLGGLD